MYVYIYTHTIVYTYVYPGDAVAVAMAVLHLQWARLYVWRKQLVLYVYMYADSNHRLESDHMISHSPLVIIRLIT